MESKGLAHKLDVEDEGKRVTDDDFKFLVGRMVVQVTEMMKILLFRCETWAQRGPCAYAALGGCFLFFLVELPV